MNLCLLNHDFCRSFRRLLSEGIDGFTSDKTVPSKQQIVSLSYINQMRPSTVLSYFFSVAPTILPMPYESSIYDEQSFMDILFRIPILSLSSSTTDKVTIGNDDVDLHVDLFPSSYRRLFPLGHLASKGYLDDNKEWIRFENEKKGWEVYQECLDTFVQRLSVCADPKEKKMLRHWYEFLLEIGDHYFGRLRS